MTARALAARDRVAELVAKAPARWGTLGRREKDVTELAALGFQNPEIAAALGLTRNTATTYMKRALHKIGARNRVELTLAFLAATGRLLPEPDPPSAPVPRPRLAGQPATAGAIR